MLGLLWMGSKTLAQDARRVLFLGLRVLFWFEFIDMRRLD